MTNCGMDLKELQNILLDILIEFNRICKKYNIKYSLAFGTLLGAVRHKGFIPWDDDVDVMMDRKNFDRFCKICPQEISKEFFFQSRKTEEKYPYNLCRIRKNNTAMIYRAWRDSGIHLGIYIDIFPIDNIADNKLSRILQFSMIFFNTPIRVARNPIIFNNRGEKFSPLLKKLVYYIARCMPYKTCEKIEDYYIKKYSNTKTKSMGIICEGGVLVKPSNVQVPFKSKYLNEYCEMEFENHKFMVSKSYRQLLRHWYGDYMKLPPEKDRVMTHQPEVFDTKNSYERYLK